MKHRGSTQQPRYQPLDQHTAPSGRRSPGTISAHEHEVLVAMGVQGHTQKECRRGKKPMAPANARGGALGTAVSSVVGGLTAWPLGQPPWMCRRGFFRECKGNQRRWHRGHCHRRSSQHSRVHQLAQMRRRHSCVHWLPRCHHQSKSRDDERETQGAGI